jgi:hypothetical protein
MPIADVDVGKVEVWTAWHAAVHQFLDDKNRWRDVFPKDGAAHDSGERDRQFHLAAVCVRGHECPCGCSGNRNCCKQCCRGKKVHLDYSLGGDKGANSNSGPTNCRSVCSLGCIIYSLHCSSTYRKGIQSLGKQSLRFPAQGTGYEAILTRSHR